MTEREKEILDRITWISGGNPVIRELKADIRYLLDEVDRLRGQLAEVRGLLDDAFDPDAHDSADLYDAQGVNQAHRVAAGGFAPRDIDNPAATD